MNSAESYDRKFLVYKSSAGSGKTFALSRVYLKLCLQKDHEIWHYKHICALTFTNKAAAEMKERIFAYLNVFSADSALSIGEKAMLEQLMADLDMSADDIATKSKRVLLHMLNNYGDVSITTLDKFVQKLIRPFASDLKLPGNYFVELDAERVLSKAIENLFENISAKPILKETLIAYLIHQLDTEKDIRIEKLLIDLGKKIFYEDAAPYIKLLHEFQEIDFRTLIKTLFDKQRSIENQIISDTKLVLKKLDDVGIVKNDFSRGAYFGFLVKLLNSNNFNMPSVMIVSAHENGFYGTKITKKEVLDKFEEVTPNLQNHYEENVPRLKSYFNLNLVLNHIHGISLLAEISEEVDALKWTDGCIHISTFSKKIHEIVSRESAPYIYERLGERFQHYLIDEFQDTSPLQWQNLLPLVENSLATKNLNMVVGDGKQAIYRFRGGDAEQFNAMPNLPENISNVVLKQKEQTLIENYLEAQLIENYRSSPLIIDFNNWFFQNLLPLLSNQPIKAFDNFEQKPVKSESGSVHYKWIEKVRNNKRFVNHDDEDDSEEELGAMNEVFSWIHDEILACSNMQIPFGNMAVLGRTGKDLTLINTYLNNNGIKTQSAESDLIFNSVAVKMLFAAHCYFCDVEPLKMAMEVVFRAHQSKFIEMSLDEQYEILKATNFSLEEFLLKTKNIKFPKDIPSKSTYEMHLEIWNAMQSHFEWDVYVSAYMELVYEKTIADNYSKNEFINFVNEKKDGALHTVTPRSSDAVQLITQHKSKGLAFDVVILPLIDTNDKFTKGEFWVKNPLDAEEMPVALIKNIKRLEDSTYASLRVEEKNKSKEDSLNLLYVAFTRAKYHLRIANYVGKNDSKKGIDKVNLQDAILAVFEMHEKFNHDNHSLFLGEIQKTERAKEEALDSKIINPVFRRWNNQISISKSDVNIFGDLQNNPRFLGDVVHEVMSEIHHWNQKQEALDNAKNRFLLDAQEVAFLNSIIENVRQIPNVDMFFDSSAKIFTERSIMLEDGTILVPDRISIFEDSILLLDYKTGIETDTYENQIRKYVEVLQKIYPNKKLRAFIAYIQSAELQEIAF